MSDDRSTFETTRARLEDLVVQVRRKDVSLEQSLDMLEEAVRLVNQCNDLIDQTSFRAPVSEDATEPDDAAAPSEAATETTTPDAEDTSDEGEDASVEVVTMVETIEVFDLDDPEIEDDERS
jgi:exodeoxyribonuclease VII small subunit